MNVMYVWTEINDLHSVMYVVLLFELCAKKITFLIIWKIIHEKIGSTRCLDPTG